MPEAQLADADDDDDDLMAWLDGVVIATPRARPREETFEFRAGINTDDAEVRAALMVGLHTP